MTGIEMAAKAAGDWWAVRLADKYADRREVFRQAVAALTARVLRGEVWWVTVAWKTVRKEGNREPLQYLRLEFDYDPCNVLDAALAESIPGIKAWDMKKALPQKHEFFIKLNTQLVYTKEGYGNFKEPMFLDVAAALAEQEWNKLMRGQNK